jgi:tetratricopeptide (TPR) repeat protein
MQDYSHADQDGSREAIEKFEELANLNQASYFDVFQIESIVEFYNAKNMFDKAESALKMGLRQHPDAISLQLKYSTVLIEQHKFDEAHKILNYLKEIEKNNAEIFLNLGIIQVKSHEKKEALQSFTKALKLIGKEDLEEYIFEISFNLNQEAYYQEAHNLITNYQPQFENNENILFELAYAFDKLNEHSKGIETYNKLLDINPYLENAWYNLGVLHSKKEEYLAAIEAYDMTTAIAPNLSEAYYNKANSLAQMGEFIEALESYTEYLSYTFPSPTIYYYMGDCWENLENNKLAFRFYELAISIDPTHFEALQALGRTAYHIQEYETSIWAFDKAISLQPESSELWRALGKSYYKHKQNTEAKRCFKTALIHKNDDTLCWIELYQFLEENEKDFNPIPFLNHLLKKDTENGALHYLAAVIHNNNNNYSDALRHLVIARQLQPNGLEITLNEYPELISIPEIAEFLKNQ